MPDTIDFSKLPLGRKAGVVHDRRTLQTAHYVDLEAALPTAPKRVQHSRGLTWGMLGNDQKGDCTYAGKAHLHHGVSREPEPSADVVVNAYLKFTHGQDSGAYELDVLNDWRSEDDGVAGTIEAFAAVKLEDRSLIHVAAWLFGGLYIGISLPISAQGQRVWDVVGDGKTGDSAPGSWGGHCVYVPDSLGVGAASGFGLVTWGMLMKMTWRFWQTYVDEAYVVLHPAWLARMKHRALFAEDALRRDLALVTG